MRSDGGYEVIKKAIQKLGLRHREHIAAYGDGNERRLTGRHETADINTFIWVSDRNLIPTAHFFHQPDHTQRHIYGLISLFLFRVSPTAARRCGSAATPRRKAKVRDAVRAAKLSLAGFRKVSMGVLCLMKQGLNRAGFSWLVAGYFEDRRPASNMDPYVVTSLIAETTILWEPSHSNGNGVAAA